jgi:hypothetical protein
MHGHQGVRFHGTAAGRAQENQAPGQPEMWDLISLTGFRECSSVVLLLAEENQAAGVLGPGFLHGLQGAQFSSTATG